MMNKIIYLFVFGFLSQSSQAASSLEAYFNYNQQKFYSDPYRRVERRGDDLEAVLLKEIAKARHTILVAVQELRLPLVAKALVQKEKEGIRVKVVLENLYNNTVLELHKISLVGIDEIEEENHSRHRYMDLFALVDTDRNGEITNREMLQNDAIFILRQGGIQIKDDTFDVSQGTGLMHHKFIVVDNKTVVVGSTNFTLSCVHGDVLDKKTTGNMNNMVVIRSPEVASFFTEEFNYMWGGPDGRRPPLFGMNKPYRGRMSADVGGARVWVQFSPTSKRRQWEETVNGLIAENLINAKSEVLISLFVFSDQNIANVLKYKIAEDNINLGVMAERQFALRSYSEILDIWGLKLLDENCEYEENNTPWRVPVRNSVGIARRTQGDYLHHKFAVVDRETVIFGSQNWSDTANYINDENLIVIQDKKIADKFAQEHERIASSSYMGPPSLLMRNIQEAQRECSLY